MAEKKSRSKIGKSNRDRGAAAERQVRDIFRAHGFDAVRRGMVFAHEPDIVGVQGLHIEVKYQKRPAVYDWIYQAEADSKIRDDGEPVVWFRRPGDQWHVIITGRLFLEMYAAWIREKCGNE